MNFLKKLLNTKLTSILYITILCLKPNIGVADAGGQQSQVDVSAMVVPFCSVNTNSLAFPGYRLASIQAVTSILITCTNGTNYSISLNNSKEGSNNEIRKMRFNTNTLNYQLYQDEKMSRIWGDNQNNSLIGIGTGQLQIHKVYGVIPANQLGPMGEYNDNILVNTNILNPNTQGNLSAYQMMVRINVSVNKL